jgi:hypothetical protein
MTRVLKAGLVIVMAVAAARLFAAQPVPWDHGSTDGEIFTAIKRGLPPTMMAGYDGRLSDTEIGQIVSYLRSLASAR